MITVPGIMATAIGDTSVTVHLRVSRFADLIAQRERRPYEEGDFVQIIIQYASEANSRESSDHVTDLVGVLICFAQKLPNRTMDARRPHHVRRP